MTGEKVERFRYMTNDVVSPWMSREELLMAKEQGEIRLDSFIQSDASAEWTIASDIEWLFTPMEHGAFQTSETNSDSNENLAVRFAKYRYWNFLLWNLAFVAFLVVAVMLYFTSESFTELDRRTKNLQVQVDKQKKEILVLESETKNLQVQVDKQEKEILVLESDLTSHDHPHTHPR